MALFRNLIADSFRTSNSKLVSHLGSSKRRKFAKLVRDPEMFFRDALSNTIDGFGGTRTTPGNTDYEPLEELLSRRHRPDCISDVTSEVDLLVQYLLRRTVYLQILESCPTNTLRVLVKGQDLYWLLEKLAEYDSNEFSLRIVPNPKTIPSGYQGKVWVTFVKGDVEYRNPSIEFDPWYQRNGRVFTTNSTAPVSSIEEKFLNRTVCALTPAILQGEVDQNFREKVSFEKILRLSPPIYATAPFPIDLVYTWVNGADKDWKKKRDKHLPLAGKTGHSDNTSEARYRDREELKYSLRSVASHFESVRKIFIVTDQQIPEWLDMDHPMITVVDHREIFPDQADLPTFNSHAIETNLHRIPGLSEHFLYLNDDCFFWNNCDISDFFFSNGISKFFPEEENNIYGEVGLYNPGFKNAALNVNRLLGEKYGLGLYAYNLHTPIALRKTLMAEMWDEFSQPLAQTSKSRFRHFEDVSPVSCLYQAFAYMKGAAVPDTISNCMIQSTHPLLKHHLKVLRFDAQTKTVCFSDSGDVDWGVEDLMNSCLNERFSIPSPWERIL